MTPLLAGVAHRRNYEGTSNRDRGLLAELDPNLYPQVVEGDWVFVTNNESDFRTLAELEQFHPGLIVLPQDTRAQQCARLDEVLDYIEKHAATDGEDPGVWMINRVVEYEEATGAIRHYWLPSQ